VIGTLLCSLLLFNFCGQRSNVQLAQYCATNKTVYQWVEWFPTGRRRIVDDGRSDIRQPQAIFIDGIRELADRRNKFEKNLDDYVEK